MTPTPIPSSRKRIAATLGAFAAMSVVALVSVGGTVAEATVPPTDPPATTIEPPPTTDPPPPPTIEPPPTTEPPESTVVESTVPETTIVETSLPPESTVPESTIVETSVPVESTIVETSVPESSVPTETTEPPEPPPLCSVYNDTFVLSPDLTLFTVIPGDGEGTVTAISARVYRESGAVELTASSAGVFALPPTPAGEALAVEGEIIRTFPDGETLECDGGQIGGFPDVSNTAAEAGKLSAPCERSENPPAVQPTTPFNDTVMIDPATGAVNVSVDPSPYYFADVPREGYLDPETAAAYDAMYGIDDIFVVELFRVVDGRLVPLTPEFQAQPGETVTVEVQRTIDIGYTSSSPYLVSICQVSATRPAGQPTTPTTEISEVGPTSTTAPAIPATLPVTGSQTGAFLMLGGALVAAGAGLLLVRRLKGEVTS